MPAAPGVCAEGVDYGGAHIVGCFEGGGAGRGGAKREGRIGAGGIVDMEVGIVGQVAESFESTRSDPLESF